MPVQPFKLLYYLLVGVVVALGTEIVVEDLQFRLPFRGLLVVCQATVCEKVSDNARLVRNVVGVIILLFWSVRCFRVQMSVFRSLRTRRDLYLTTRTVSCPFSLS